MNDIPKENIEEPKNEIVIEPTIDEVVEPSTDIVKDSEQPTALTQNIFVKPGLVGSISTLTLSTALPYPKGFAKPSASK